MSDDFGRRSYRDEDTRDPWLDREGESRGEPWPTDEGERAAHEPWDRGDERDRTSDGWGERDDRSRRDSWGADESRSDWRDDSERRLDAWGEEESDPDTQSWRSRVGADLDRDEVDEYGRGDFDGEDGDRGDEDRLEFERSEIGGGGERPATTLTEAPARTAEEREQDALRSFVESEELPSPERMAAAELEAEREAARDAAALSESEVADTRRGRFGERSVDGRMARLHLRGGLIPLARAELETMAGRVTLDLEALADLAEARWRSGDLLGAGEAAQAHLSRGGDEVTALVVAVEALTAQGRTIDARRLAAQVLERTGGELDTIFAGQPRAQLWSRPAEGRAVDEEPEPEDERVERGEAEQEPLGERDLGERDAMQQRAEGAIALGDSEEARTPIEETAREETEESIWDDTREAAPPTRSAAEFGVVSSAPGARDESTLTREAEEAAAWPAADLDRPREAVSWPSSEPGEEQELAPVTGVAEDERTLEAAGELEATRAEPGIAEEPVRAPEEVPGEQYEPAPLGAMEPAEAAVPAVGESRGEATAGELAGAARRVPSLASRRELRSIEEAIDEGRFESVMGRLALLLRTDPDAAGRIVDVAMDAIALLGPGSAVAANLEIVRGDALSVLGRADEAEAAYAASRSALEPEAPTAAVGEGELGEPSVSDISGVPADAAAVREESSYAGELVEPTGPIEPGPTAEPAPFADQWTEAPGAEEPAAESAEPGDWPVESAQPGEPAVESAEPGEPAVESAEPGEPAVKSAELATDDEAVPVADDEAGRVGYDDAPSVGDEVPSAGHNEQASEESSIERDEDAPP